MGKKIDAIVILSKPNVERRATATGLLKLSSRSFDAIKIICTQGRCFGSINNCCNPSVKETPRIIPIAILFR